MENKQLIETFINKGINMGRCWWCKNYFKKNDLVIVFEKVKVYKILRRKICIKCYLSQVATIIGWKKLNALILKMCEEKI